MTEVSADPLQNLRVAKTKYQIASALDAIKACKEAVPLDPLIVEYARDKRWLVRQSAIEAVGSCADSGVESVLLELGATAQDEQDLVYINACLGDVGGRESLGYLESCVGHPKEDVATSALFALTRIGSIAQLPCFLGALGDRRWPIKWYAMDAIDAHGDMSAVPAVLARVKRILGRKRSHLQAGRSELTAGLSFLSRHQSDASIGAFFRDYLQKRRDRLSADEIAALDQLLSGE